MDTGIELLPYIIKTALTPALSKSLYFLSFHYRLSTYVAETVRLNPIIAEEVIEALRLELPQSNSWVEVKITERIMRVIAIASGRIFVGPELCRNEEYLDASINYTIDVMTAMRAVADISPWLRPFQAARTPEVKRVNQRFIEADAFLRPVVAARREAAKNPDYQKPDDMLEWMMEAHTKFAQNDDDKELARYQLGISFAAIHTTTTTTINA